MVIESRATPRTGTRPDDGLADFLPDAYLETDLSGRIYRANAAVSALAGFARSYAIGKPIQILFQPTSLDALRDRVARAAGGDIRHGEFAALLRGQRQGPPRRAHVWHSVIRDDSGTPVGIRWLVRDITEEAHTAARLAEADARHARELRTATMELEATVRLLQATHGTRMPVSAVDTEAGLGQPYIAAATLT